MTDLIDAIKDAPNGVLDMGYHPRDNDMYRWQATAPNGSACSFAAFYDLDKADEILKDCVNRQSEGRPPGHQRYTRWALVRMHFTTQLSIVREEPDV